MRTIGFTGALCALMALAGAAGARRAEAQTGKITGTVSDAANGQPLEGAQVFLQGTGRGAVTGADGRFFILSVPPGEYTVIARRLGYQTEERRSVQVAIDVTRELTFRLGSTTGQIATVRIEAEQEPLILPGTTGSRSTIGAEEIASLPVTSIASALSLQLGYLSVPVENFDVTSYADERRGVNLTRIRGGRAAETLTLIDGIPVNNFVLGGPSLDLNSEVVEQLSFERGGFEAQYGNAMSGIINIATKEGTTQMRGALNYSTSRLASALGSAADSVRGADYIQGYMSGPVPGTGQKVRWIVAGRQNTSAARALQFDNDIFNPFANPGDPIRGNVASAPDLFPGWRGVGFLATRDLFGKLTTYFTPSMKLNLGYVDYMTQNQYYNQAFSVTGYDVVAACKVDYPDMADFCETRYGLGTPTRYEELANPGTAGNFRRVQQYVIQGSTRNVRQLGWANFNHVLGRTTYQLRGGRLYTARNACNYMTGICLGDKIRNFTTAQDFAVGQFTTFSRHGAPYVNPSQGSENFAGGDTNTTWIMRADLQSQVTDHHNVQVGGSFQRHDIRFYEAKNVTKPFDRNTVVNYVYGGRPWDAAIYLQDRVEYDFLTLKLGLRFDYTRATGDFFVNPLDPTNGTTAYEVCEGIAPAVGATAPYTLTTGDRTISGIAACNASPDSLLRLATRQAFADDFGPAPVRKQFSPRVGVQFPISQTSSFFANWGIYSQNPTYNNMYSGTGIGRVADSTITDPRQFTGTTTIARGTSLEGTPFGPNFRQDAGNVPLVGNPRLEIERTSAYELGFLSELSRNWALTVTGYAKDQSGLTGFRRGGRLANGQTVVDFGQTYNPNGTGIDYFVLVNTDYQTVRGVEITTRRKLANYWALTLQYGYQQVTTNAAPPDLELQKLLEGDVQVREEIRSEIDQPHLFTSVLRFEFDNTVPQFRFSNLLKHSKFTITNRAASGLPYTPTLTFAGNPSDRLERNSGTGPMTWSVDLRAEKAWTSGNLRYAGFVSVSNLLDRKNCVQPYTTTGRCDAGSLPFSRLGVGVRQGGSDPQLAATGGSSTQFDRPNLYGERRAISTGVRVSF